MAIGMISHGPCKVEMSSLTYSAAYSDLGYTDNSDLIQFELEHIKEPVFTTRMGEIPEDWVHQGSVGHLSFTLIKWDTTEVAKLAYAVPGGAAEGDVGNIGEFHLNSTENFSFAIKFTGTASNDTYTFHKCVLDGNVQLLDFGNKPQRVGLNFICLPLAAVEGNEFTSLAETDPIYTISRA